MTLKERGKDRERRREEERQREGERKIKIPNEFNQRKKRESTTGPGQLF